MFRLHKFSVCRTEVKFVHEINKMLAITVGSAMKGESCTLKSPEIEITRDKIMSWNILKSGSESIIVILSYISTPT